MTNLNQLAREVYLETKIQYSENSKLILHLSDRTTVSCQVGMDKQELRFAIVSLISNAIKSSQGQGDVFVELRQQGWKCAVDVVDYGTESFQKAFQKPPLLQHHALPASQDWGLPRVSELLKSSHGALSFEGFRGAGNRVRIELPVLSEAEQMQQA